MALENANYIPELDETNPPGNDPANQLDDHHRVTKRSVKNSFSGFVGTTASPKSVTLTEDQINDAALKSVENTFGPRQQFSLGTQVPNNVAYSVTELDGTTRRLMGYMDPSNVLQLGDPNNSAVLSALATAAIDIGGVEVAQAVARSLGSLLVRDRTGVAKKAGFRNPSRRQISANDTLTQNDEGAIVETSTSGITITVPSLESQTIMRVMNRSGSPISIVRDAGVIFEWYNGAGNPPNQDLTLNGGSIIELVWRSATTVQIFGNGLS